MVAGDRFKFYFPHSAGKRSCPDIICDLLSVISTPHIDDGRNFNEE